MDKRVKRYIVKMSCDGHFEQEYEIDAVSEFIALNHTKAMYTEFIKAMFEVRVEVQDEY